MNKKIMAAVLIAVMGALTLSIALHSALCLKVDISGADYGYYNYVSPVFCECYHDTTPDTLTDTEVGLGVQANYDYANQQIAFSSAYWAFEDEAGGSSGYYNKMIPGDPLICEACINANQACYYYDYSTPQVNTPLYANYNCLNVVYTYNGNLADASSVEGQTTAYFQQISNPTNTWSLQAETQNPPGQSGNGWAFLTAHP